MELRMNHDRPIAHVSEDGRCHLLYDHLVGTAKMAGEFGCAKWGWLTGRVDHSAVGGIFAGEKFADKFGAGELTYWVGLWHDIGKYHPTFQDYLQKCEGKPEKMHRGTEHKGAGEILALNNLDPMAFLVAGHHSVVIDQGIVG